MSKKRYGLTDTMDTLYEKYMLENPEDAVLQELPIAGETDPVDSTEAIPLPKASDYGSVPYGDQILTQIL